MENRMLVHLKRCLLVGGASCLMVSCEDADETKRLKDSIQSKEETIADVEARTESEKKALEENQALRNTEENYKEVTKKLEEIEAQLELEKGKTKEARAAVKTASLNLINYRNQYRRSQREKAKGSMIDLSATMGAEFKDVKITRITPLELRVLLTSGPKGIPFQELPVEVQEQFQFSEEEATAYQRAVAQIRLAQAKNSTVVEADKEIEQATLKAAEAAGAIDEKKSLIASINRQIKSKELEAERVESLSRHWKLEKDNSGGGRRAAAAGERAAKLGEQANGIRQEIARAKEKILSLRQEIGQLLKTP